MPATPTATHPDLPETARSSLAGLDPVGLLDVVIEGASGEWQPLAPEVLEAAFSGYDEFAFIDRGGMGAVYSARQKSLERRVAIKILPPELGQDPGFVERFHQEARLLAKLRHPHIVTIYDFGKTAAGHLFIVMEFIEGASLLQMIKGHRLNVVTVLEIVSQVCQALQFAHEHGVVHRDIKPNNILVDEHGKVRVADFGLAKLAGPNRIGITSTQTQTGRALGTPGYAAPEQRRGDPEVDCRADIFSLGMTLYEALTGHVPVGVFEAPSRKVGSPRALDRVVLRCLQEQPELRYQTAAQMLKAIQPIATKLGAPLFRRRLLQRPLTAGVICIQLLVTGWLLTDKVMRKEPAPTDLGGSQGSVPESGDPTPLVGRFALVQEAMSWNQARERWAQHPRYRPAKILNEQEQEMIAKALEDSAAPFIWLGGHRLAETEVLQWWDGTAVEFAAWMPDHDGSAVLVTEIQTHNVNTLRNSSGGATAWVELYNTSDKPVDLRYWRLLLLTPGRGAAAWLRAPNGVPTLIGPRGYRIVHFGMRRGDEKELSLPFALQTSDATLWWCNPKGEVLQAFQPPWPTLAPDTSIGGNEIGDDWGVCETPTPGAPNSRRIRPIPRPNRKVDAPLALMIVPEAGCAWTLGLTQRRAWLLVEKIP